MRSLSRLPALLILAGCVNGTPVEPQSLPAYKITTVVQTPTIYLEITRDSIHAQVR